jgi:hypothetical protein
LALRASAVAGDNNVDRAQTPSVVGLLSNVDRNVLDVPSWLTHQHGSFELRLIVHALRDGVIDRISMPQVSDGPNHEACDDGQDHPLPCSQLTDRH